MQIRNSTASDNLSLELLYRRAFPHEDLVPLVNQLLAQPDLVLSLVGVTDEVVSGHGLFTFCHVPELDCEAALLGPLAVKPSCQGQGIGSAIVQHGIQVLDDRGIELIFVLGDPAYYARFGFRPEKLIDPPFGFPTQLKGTELWQQWKDAWQSRALPSVPVTKPGKLAVPGPWQDPALWMP